ncbi:phospholipid-transporting ATPase ABCA3 isoform X2 [Leptinotarsa decemlineata]|uniref:phospholipid-transporting ATPase ABCA3 isoform X2 n=1 Tax=Leptinotarsa decemlineata TaxID=7539 RepID=UPI003D303ECD
MNSRSHSYSLLRQNGTTLESEDTMGRNLDKFILLMWKNWVLQYRKPIQTLIEIVTPVLFCIILVIIRGLSDPELRKDQIYPPFSPIPNKDQIVSLFRASDDKLYGNNVLLYSPKNEEFEKVMGFFRYAFKNVTGVANSDDLETRFLTNSANSTFAGIDFGDRYLNISSLNDIKDMRISIRFPGELKLTSNLEENWKTNLVYPVFQFAGPRSYPDPTGSIPNYYKEGFLGLQYAVTASLILASNNFTFDNFNDPNLASWALENRVPDINMRRFPYAAWSEDPLLVVLKAVLGLIIMISFVYTAINNIRAITTEKEKQLKEAMKIMGLPNWLHWLAWFTKNFIFLLISAIIMVVLLKVNWYKNSDSTVFTHADPTVILVFLLFYIVSTITFCFMVSVFFSKANTAATIASIAWFLSYAPFTFMQRNYENVSATTKISSSLAHNTAMAFGFQVIIMYEGTQEGVQWNNIFKPNTPDDSLSLGLIMVMMALDSVIYMLVTIYVEAVNPGEYGVALPWYFPFTASYWCGQRHIGVEDTNDGYSSNEGEFFEDDPRNLKPGIQIKNLCKVFGNKTVVRNFSLNMYEDQITVLLGHNGAGKTTTMSMLTGMITPTSGSGRINGCDLRTNMDGVRSSLGLCPQHNIIFDDLTVSEHIYFFSKLKGLSGKQVEQDIDKYINLLELEPKRNQKSSSLSGGMKRKLCVAMALCGNSKVIMLDEPTAGMDPSARRALWNLLQSQKEGRTMLLTTHFMDEADLLGDRIAIMAGGELQCCGSSFFLKKKYGAGYSLIMDKTKDCDAGQVTRLLRKYIPDIEIHSNVGSELTYLLEDSQAAIFEPLLQEVEHESKRLGIRGYGISLTTLEEVFLKVGADHGQEEINNGLLPEKEENNRQQRNNNKVKASMSPYYTSGSGLVMNQFRAMFMKKIVTTIRSWIMLCIQLVLPSIFLMIALIVARNKQVSENLPPMVMNLDKFENSITKIHNIGKIDYCGNYTDVLGKYGYSYQNETDIIASMLDLTRTNPNLARRRYIVGASFDERSVPNITAWFNNDPYHSPGISLGLVLDSVYQKLFNGCNNECSLEFTNHPFPYTAQTQINQLLTGQSMGFQLAVNVGFSMTFVSSFYVIFIVKEIKSGSKHLQFVSGVKPYVFWLTQILSDFLTYLATIIIYLITMVCFQEDGYNTAGDIGRMFIILVVFAWAFLPFTYLAGYFFDEPSTGYTRLSLIGIFAGNIIFLVVQVLMNPGLKLEHVGKALHWLFLLNPHYSLASAISESYNVFAYNNVCEKIFENCAKVNLTRQACLDAPDSTQIKDICTDIDTDYFKWEEHGIGRNMLYSFLTGLVMYIILYAVEYEVFSKLIYFLEKRFFATHPVETTDEDADVAEEKDKIRNATEADLCSTFQLAIRDLTKYYKKFLAVNGLCLGVKKYECFGLLGINGAGKTTTFKMMTGDVKISYGDGWVNGKSIKSQLKEVQKAIGYCPQFDALLEDMTAQETIVMFSLLRGIRLKDAHNVAQFLSEEFDFQRHLKKKVKELSGGNKRKLSTALSLIGDPPVLYLDEPTTGMDPATKRYLWNALCKIRDNGKCIILTSHSMEECEALCTRLAIMVNGNFQCLGSTQHLKNKFAEGYTLTIKMKKLPESSGLQHSETDPTERFIKEHFPSAQLREKHQELLTYYITDKSTPWSKMFGILEKGKRSDLNIEDYSLGQSSLEQVFLTFTRNQNEMT